MKNLIGVVLLLVGAGIGFGIGRIGNGDTAVQDPVVQGKDKALLEAERRIASLEKELAAAKKPRSVKTAVAKKEEVMSKMKGYFPDSETLQELAMIQMQMGSRAKKERSMLARELGREMGYSGEDLEVVHDAVENIYDCTSPGGLQDAFGAGDDDTDVNVSTQVISL